MKSRTTRAAALLTALALTVSLAGCGSSSKVTASADTASSTAASSQAVATPSPTPTVDPDETITLTGSTITTTTDFAGKVESTDETKVTPHSYVAGYKVAQMLVSVGDTITENQVIAKMDTTDINSRLTKAQTTYNDNVKKAQADVTTAQTAYDKAKTAYDTANKNLDSTKTTLRDKMNKAEGELTTYKKATTEAQNTYNTAKTSYDNLVTAYNNARAQLSYLAGVKDQMAAQVTNAQARYDNAEAAFNTAYDAGTDYDTAFAAFQELVQASYDLNGDAEYWVGWSYSFPNPVTGEEDLWINYQGNYYLSYDESVTGQYTAAVNAYNEAEKNLSIPSMNLYGVTAIESAVSSAKTAMDNAKTALDKATANQATAQTAYDTAKKNYENASSGVDSAKKTMDEASTKLKNAQAALDKAKAATSDINNLKSMLTLCDVRTPVCGVVKSVDTPAGSVMKTSLITVDDVKELNIRIEVSKEQAEQQVIRMQLQGTINGTIAAAVYQCSTTAESDGKYYAYIRPVSEDETGIKYGDSVTVTLPTSSEFLYTVPGDAVGTNADGSNYVLGAYDGEYYKVAVTVKGTDSSGNSLLAPQGLTQGTVIAAHVALVDTAKIHSFEVNTDLDAVKEGEYDYAASQAAA